MKFKIPRPLKLEHGELHGKLVKTIAEGGKIGYAATAVAKILHPHFIKEEEYALPPLGLLVSLNKKRVSSEMEGVLSMTDRLKKDLPQMLKEHKAIVAKLKKLVSAAKKEKRPEFAHFGEKLMIHAQTEEEVLYPAAILIGEFIKLKLKE